MQVQYKLIDDDDYYVEVYRGLEGTYIENGVTSTVYIPDTLYQGFIEHMERLNVKID